MNIPKGVKYFYTLLAKGCKKGVKYTQKGVKKGCKTTNWYVFLLRVYKETAIFAENTPP